MVFAAVHAMTDSDAIGLTRGLESNLPQRQPPVVMIISNLLRRLSSARPKALLIGSPSGAAMVERLARHYLH